MSLNIEQRLKNFNRNLVLYVSRIRETNGKKNNSQMAREGGITHDEVNRALNFLSNNLVHAKLFLLHMGIKLMQQRHGWLVVDTTFLEKNHSTAIEGVGRGKNGSSGHVEKGLVVVFVAWTDGTIKIPLAYKTFVPEGVAGLSYINTNDLVISMVIPISQKTGCFRVLADGAFSHKKILKILNQYGIIYIMRFASNRVITTEDGKKEALTKHPALNFNKNLRLVSTMAQWHSIKIYVTGTRRRNRDNEWEYRYLISNRSIEIINHIECYEYRWTIELFFRVAKQNLGISDCQSRSLNQQKAHIAAVCFAFIGREIKSMLKIGKFKQTTDSDAKSVIAIEEIVSQCGEFLYYA